VARCRLVAALVCLLLPAAAQAQSSDFTGFVTLSAGRVHSGDVRDSSWSPGVSMVVVEASGWGAELDIAHSGQFDASRFVDSRLTTVALNVTGIFMDPLALVRPYVIGGVGLVWARTCLVDCRQAVNHTDLGFDVGGGALVMFNEAIGVRGDVRYFRFFEQEGTLPLPGYDTFGFWRTSVGLTFSWPIR
jgi:opacity protein-like surface antigen